MLPAAAESTRHGWWGRTWRIALLAVAGLLCALFVYGSMLESVPIDSPAADAMATRMLADLAIGIVALVLVGLRHRMPLLAPCLVIAASGFSAFAAPAAAALLISVAARHRRRDLILAAVLFFIAGYISAVLDPLAEQMPFWQLVVMIAIVEAEPIESEIESAEELKPWFCGDEYASVRTVRRGYISPIPRPDNAHPTISTAG